jgi:hypothetical protein
MARLRDRGGISARVEDSGKGDMADGNIESLLDLYWHELHILRVLSPGAIEILVTAEGGRVC